MQDLCKIRLTVKLAYASSTAKPWTIVFFAVVLAFCQNVLADAGNLYMELPKTGLTPRELAVVVNESDPESARIAEYYRVKRSIPNENVLHVRFPAGSSNLPREAFDGLREQLLRLTGHHIQAYALAWTKPYRVDCMSITSAIALGFDEAYCSSRRCAPTKPSSYFNSVSFAPYEDHRIRPAMLLAGNSFDNVKRLIDRGAASDHTYPDRTGYLLNTADKSRSVRSAFFDDAINTLGNAFRVVRLEADSIKDKTDVLFYFTGLVRVPDLPTLRFVPGAMADHLTSAGGILDGDGQMSILRWLEAGATGSYGTVVEPCNHPQKFPLPAVAMRHYAMGNSLVEAYWKSVAWPGEGLFIGEPLAHPFAPMLSETDQRGTAILKFFSLEQSAVDLAASKSPVGPYRPTRHFAVRPGLNEISVRPPEPERFYRIVFPK